MTSKHDVLAYGLDYLRFKVFSERDVISIASRLHYVDINTPWYHGTRFVDITGSQLALIRIVEYPPDVAVELARLYPVHRIDVFIDVSGDYLGDIPTLGTKIYNRNKLETVYSMNLSKRGDAPVFGRAYDARAAGHYDVQATRFEVEYKKQYALRMLTCAGWTSNPIGVALHSIKTMFGVGIDIEDVEPIEFSAPTEKLEHSRERFYSRYGKGIVNDIESMGVERFYRFIMECIQEREQDTDGDQND